MVLTGGGPGPLADRPIVPVRLEPGVRLALLADVQWIDLDAANPEPGIARLLAGLRAAGLDPADAFAWDPRRPPYPGLAPFQAQDAAVFFGREAEAARLVQLLQPTLARGPGRWVGIVGPSGSGKSSLLRAGLLPRLARTPGRWVLLPALLPGRQPIHSLAGGLARALGEAAAGAARTNTFLGERYRRIARRRGRKKAIVAVGRSVLIIIWQLLSTDNAAFTDLGADFYDNRRGTQRAVRNHIRGLQALGYQVTLQAAA
jgi:AAA ATPase domain